MKFKKKFLQDIASECWDQEKYNIEIVKDEICSTSRWSNQYDLIFKFDEKYYQTWYSRGATETQDERPWEYDKDIIIVNEVVPYTKTIVDYKIKENQNNG